MNLNDEELKNLMSNKKTDYAKSAQDSTLKNLQIFADNSVTKSNNESINNSKLNFINNFMTKRKFAVLGVICLVLLSVVASAGLSLVLLYSRSNTSTLTAAQQADILSKIALNNPNIQRSNSFTAEGAANSLMAPTASTLDSKMVAPYWNSNPDLNYFYNKGTTVRGAAFTRCTYGADFSNDVFVPVTESFNFSDSNGYYSKYISYNEDGSINNYSLSTTTNTADTSKYESINYLGGDYAVRTSSEFSNVLMNATSGSAQEVKPLSALDEPVSSPITEPNNPVSAPDSTPLPNEPTSTEPAPTPEPTVPDVTSYFGPDVQVLRTETINGKDYYVIQYSYDVNCSGYTNYNRWESPTQEDIETIYTLSYANTQDYQILKTETYLGSVSDSNLIQRYTNEVSDQKTDFASVSGNFNFDINVPVKDIVYDNSAVTYTYDPAAEVQKTLDYISTQNISVLLPTVSQSNYIYFNNPQTTQYIDTQINYYSDRSFYPAGAIGDKMYNSYNGVFDNIKVATVIGSSSFSNDSASYNLDIYSKSEENLKIVDSLLWANIRNQSETATTINVNGEYVPATLYSYETEQGGIMPLMYDSVGGSASSSLRVKGGTCDSDTCWNKNYILVFGYGNNKYSLQEYGFNSSDVDYSSTEVELNAYSTQDADGLNTIKDLLNKINVGVSVDAVPPTAL